MKRAAISLGLVLLGVVAVAATRNGVAKAEAATQSAPAPAAKPDPSPPPAPTSKPEPKPEAKPAPVSKPEPAAKPAPAPQPKPEAKPAPKPEPKPEPKPAPKPTPPVPAAQPKSEPKPQSKPQPKPEAKPAPQPKPEPKPAPAPKPEAKPAPKPAPQPKPEPKPAPAPAPQPKPEVKPEPKPEEQPKIKIAAVDFASGVMPLVSRLGCNQTACHGSLRGRGGLRLSMFGGDAAEDWAELTRGVHGRRINRIEPQKSLLLQKATGGAAHGGGAKIQPGSPEYNLLLGWIADGALWADEKVPRLAALRLSPQEQVLTKGDPGRLLATAVFSDGSREDVTADALFSSREDKVATVAEGGKVQAEDFGEAVVVASYLRQFAVARVLVPQPLPSPFPAVAANNKIDELVFAKLKRLGIPPSELSSDEEFVRRVYLDAIGTLPAPDEVRGFLGDRDPQKRARLIDRLLEREEFADFWALKWGDLLRIKSEYPVNVWPKAVHTYYRWLRTSIARNKPYDQFVRELLTANGSNFRNGPTNYFRAVPARTPQNYADGTALVFLGARMSCVRCHVHPAEDWTRQDSLGMAAFFAKVAIKQTQEWKEEIVYCNADAKLWDPQSRRIIAPKPLGAAAMELGEEGDPRVEFADWLTAPQNPWFARNIVNRVWFWLLGRGIVHEADDLRPTNPPENPELLEYLQQELVGHKFDLKHVYRLILNSRVYQLSSRPGPLNDKDLAHFSHYHVRRLAAEPLLDAVCQVTGSPESFGSWIPVPSLRLPQGRRAIQLPDADIESAFLELFGRPSRDSAYEADRNCEASPRQALHMVGSDQVQWKIASGQRIKTLLEAKKPDAEIIDELYLAALARMPGGDEKQKALAYLAQHKDRRGALEDLVWAVLNTTEFLVNH